MDEYNYSQGDIVISQQPVPDNSFEYRPSGTTVTQQPQLQQQRQHSGGTGRRQNDGGGTKSILVAILAVGICLLVVSIAGMVGAGMKPEVQQLPAETTTGAAQNENNIPVVNTTVPQNVVETTTVAETPEQTTVATDAPENNAAENNTPANAPQSDEEWLVFFNGAVNKLKTDGPAMTKSKRTQTADISLSNTLAQVYVSAAKDKYLSDETVKTPIAKGDVSSAKTVVSPDGADFVSSLAMSDIKAISHSTDADGNYVVKIDMPEATNPDTASSYAKIFEFMLVDDVMETYAPNMGATVDRANVFLNYSDCYAQAVISPDGKVVNYYTKVNANMVLKDAKISVVNTDLDVVLYSDTEYTDIQW